MKRRPYIIRSPVDGDEQPPSGTLSWEDGIGRRQRRLNNER